MKQICALIFLLSFFLLITTPINFHSGIQAEEAVASVPQIKDLGDISYIVSAGGQGQQSNGTVFFTQNVTGLVLPVLNTFDNTTQHRGVLDLTTYHIPGWALYKADMNIINITAGEECKTTTNIQESDTFRIEEYESVNGWRYNSMAQGFYAEPYDGLLLNYSFYYICIIYAPALHGWGYYSILTDYSNPLSNVTVYTQLPTNVLVGSTWENSSPSVILNNGQVYYLTINGSALIKNPSYPDIRWWSDIISGGGTFDTVRYDTKTNSWGLPENYEAMLRYTYVPWNKTAGKPLIFQQPESIDLRGNGTPLVSPSNWSFTSLDKNISKIIFDSNQSVYVYYNLTLWFRRSVTVSSIWDVPNSGSEVQWNLTVTLNYPIQSNQRFVNLTINRDWSPFGFYNGSDSTNHTSYSVSEQIVTGSSMTNGFWTLTSTAPNYVSMITVQDRLSILDNLIVTNWIRDPTSNNATTGTTNLTIWKDSSKIYSPANKTVVNGVTSYTWDIDSDTSLNGTYRIEVFWANGTEAGYRTKEFVVYYPTDLVPETTVIHAYTNNSFDVRVYFNETFTPKGINGSYAGVTVVYSFAGGTWTPLNDLANGTWTATVSTAGYPAGNYQIRINGSGFAIENQSISLDVVLTYETLPLGISWGSQYQNNITYIQQTNLTVSYKYVNGTPINGATVNVTDGTNVWSLHWDQTTSTYWFQFNGSSSTPGLGQFFLNVTAWKEGHQAQFNDTLTLIIRVEPTSIQVSWTSATFDWTESKTLYVNYTDSQNNTIAGATQHDVIVNETQYSLIISGDSYLIVFNNTFDLGHHIVFLNFSKYGYAPANFSGITFDINIAPTSLTVVWQPDDVTIEYTSNLNLTVDYTNGGTDVPDTAQVNVTIKGFVYPLSYNGTDWVVSIPGSDLGIGIYTATISAWLYGYQAQSNVTSNINITLASNSFIVEWLPSSLNATYVQTINISVTYTHNYEPVLGATVRLYINSTTIFDLTYNATTKKWHLSFAASMIGLGPWNVTVVANKTGYDTGREEQLLRIMVDNSTLSTNWQTFDLYYTHQTTLEITLQDSFGRAIDNAVVNVTYNGKNYTLSSQGGGIYKLLFNGSDGLGIYPITVRSYGYGITNHTTSLTLSIVDTPVDMSVTVTYFGFNGSVFTTLYYDGAVEFTVNIQDIDGNDLSTMTVRLQVGAVSYPLTLQGSGIYTITLNASVFGVGEQSITVLAEQYGYEDPSQLVIIQVFPVPTLLVTDINPPSIMPLNTTFEIVVQYVDEHTNTTLTPDTFEVQWPNGVVTTEIDTNIYRLTISSFALPLQNHILNITLTKANYSVSQLVTTITVRALYTTFIAPAEYHTAENETISFTVEYYDVDRNVPISWAQVTVLVGSVSYNMSYIGDGVYGVDVRITLTPGTHTVTYQASAVGCYSNTTSSTLVVNQKYYVILEFDLPSSAVEGAPITVGAIIKDKDTGTPLVGVALRFRVVAYLRNGSQVETTFYDTTDTNGYASQAYTVVEGAENLTIAVVFSGSFTYWAAMAETSIPVRSGIAAILSIPMVRMFLTIGLPLIVVLGITFAVYSKGHKPRKQRHEQYLKEQLRRFRDLTSLRHFMAVYRERGTCVFYYPFTDERIQPDLISGFITAVTSVYGEITGEGIQGTLEEIHYKGLLLSSFSGKYILGILILEGEMTPFLRERLKFFVEMFEDQYESDLHEWSGLVECFDTEWVVSTLHSTLGYDLIVPHRVEQPRRAKGKEKQILQIIEEKLDERGEFRFQNLLSDIADRLKISEEEALEYLQTMREKGIVKPIRISTILTRQGFITAGETPEPVEPTALLRIPDTEAEETGSKEKTDEEPPEKEEPETESRKTEEIDDAEKFIQEVERLLAEEKKNKEQNDEDRG